MPQFKNMYIGNRRVFPDRAYIGAAKYDDFSTMTNNELITEFDTVERMGLSNGVLVATPLTYADSSPAYVNKLLTTSGQDYNCIEVTFMKTNVAAAHVSSYIGISNTSSVNDFTQDGLFANMNSELNSNNAIGEYIYGWGATVFSQTYWTTPVYNEIEWKYISNLGPWTFKYNWDTGKWTISNYGKTLATGTDTDYRLSIHNQLQGDIYLYLGTDAARGKASFSSVLYKLMKEY